MRKNDPSVFINATVGTWASPYFTFYVDSIWRGGVDMDKAGTGSIRQQWMNYRDKVSQDLLKKNPYYPLNSLMVHGIVHSRFGQGAWNSHLGGTESGPLLDMTDPAKLKDFADEVWSYFASGYNLQELYIRPTSDYTTDKMWDILAEASSWAQLNHDVLLDSHFIGGGDPGKGEPYGIASYSTAKSVVMLRNPGNTSQTMNVDVNEAFVLPPGAKTGYRLVNKLKNEADLHLTAGVPYGITIPANSIVLYEVYPEGTVVIPDATADSKAVALDKAVLDIGYANGDSVSQVTKSLILNASGTNGSTITWNSSVPLIVSTDGTVTRPSYTSGDATVTLTASISKGAAADTKTFTLKVLKQSDTTPPTSTATLQGPASVSSGQTFDVTYALNTVSNNVYAQEVTIAYDPQQLEYVAANSLVDDWKIFAVSTETNGKIRLIAANVGSNHRAAGELFKLTLKVKASSVGSSTIALTNAAYASGEGVETTVQGSAYYVQIAAGTQGDLNGDHKFSIGDLAMVASYYGKTSADLNWIEIYKKADMNNDGEINILDLAAVAQLILS
jgi:hypothetical protein